MTFEDKRCFHPLIEIHLVFLLPEDRLSQNISDKLFCLGISGFTLKNLLK